jgi:hypothetical protein
MNALEFFDSYSKLEFASLYLHECNNSKIANDYLRNELFTLKQKLKDLERNE